MKQKPFFTVYSTEDNLNHQELLEIAFDRAGAQVRIRFFNTAEELLSAVRKAAEAPIDRSWLPDLFLIDVKLPGISGVDLVRTLKAEPFTAHTPMVMLSSSIAHRDREAAFAVWADDYFIKPVSLGDLIKMVENIVSDWHNAKVAEET